MRINRKQNLRKSAGEISANLRETTAFLHQQSGDKDFSQITADK
jgi:ribulose-5-phosphate 4-epimerase/fuculose-1-phosphate aldolase